MKKKILAILLSVSIVFSAVSVAIAAPSDPVSIQSASYTQTAPVVDGEKEDAYKSATPILIDQGIEQGYVTGNDYATASAYALFDDEYMYVLVEVNDPTPKFNRGNEEIKRDVEGVNFYIDLLNTAETDYLPGTRDPIAGEQGRIQTNFIAKESGDAFYTGGSNNLNSYVMTDGRPFTGEFTAALKQTSVGYNVELKVKMSANLKKRISTVKNPAIGFGIQLNDDKDDSYAGDNSGRDGVLVNDMGVHGEWYSWEDACQGSKGFPDVTLRNTAPVTVGTTVTGGILSVDVEAEGIIGQTVNITAAPDEGKRLQSILVNGTPIKGTSFALPAAGAVVTAVFVDKSEVTIPKEDEKGIPNFMAGFGTALLDGQKDAAYSAGETVIVNTDHTGTVPSLSPALVAAAPLAAGENDIRVMGWNLLNTPGTIENWEEYFTVNKRGERTVDIIGRYDADSIGFQEGNLNWKNFLNVNLTNYTIVPATQAFTDPIYYRQDRLELMDSGVFWLSDTPDVPSKQSDAAEERVCTWAIFRNKATDVMYAHFNTHLDHISDEARTVGMRVIREKIEVFRTEKGYSELGIVATGDFNGNRATDAYQLMVSDYPNVDMQDSLYCAPEDQVVNEGQTLIDGSLMISEDLSDYDGGLAIDHMFVSIDALDVRSYKVMREGDRNNPRLAASDHFGIYVELNVGEGEIRRNPEDIRERASFGEITVDGEKDAAYAQSTVGSVTSVYSDNKVTLPKEEMTSASYSFAHDEDYLYYYIKVTDYHVSVAGGDKIEIYYNFLRGSTNPKEYTAATKNDGEAGYFTVYADGSPITYNSNKVSSETAAELGSYAVKTTGSGYVIEGKIPLSTSVKAQLIGDKDIEIGMGILLQDDADGNGERDYYMVNVGEGNVLEAWGNPSMMLPLWMEPNEGSAVPNSAVYGTPTLDGVLDEVYKKSAVGTIANATLCGTELPTTERTAATYRFVYDNHYLYYFIDVTDSHVTNSEKHVGESDGEKGIDGIEIYYNFLKGTTNPTSYDGLSGEASYFTSYANGDANSKGFEYTALPTATGYVLEGKIPLHACVKSVLAAADAPVEIGVGFIINDDANNGVGGRDYFIVNEDKVLAAWGQPNQTTSLYCIPDKNAEEIIAGGAIDRSTQRAAFGTAILDGNLDDAYLKSTADTFRFNGTGNSDTNGVYRFIHDNEYLYFHMDITDKNVTSPETIDQQADHNGIDGAQLYYDFLNTDYGSAKNPSAYRSYTWSYCNANGNEAGYFGMFANGNPIWLEQGSADGIEYVAKHTQNGYVLEGKVPLSATLKAKLAQELETAIGFGIQLNDDTNDDGIRNNYLMSREAILSAWSQPYSMTEMILEPDYYAENGSAHVAVSGTPEIDGKLDAAYDRAPAILLNKELYSNKVITGAASGAAKAIYDSDYLYLFAEIQDSSLNSRDVHPKDDNSDLDGVQFYLDFTDGSSAEFTPGKSGYLMLDVNDYETTLQNGTPVERWGYSGKLESVYKDNRKKCSWSVVRTDNGYNIEIRFELPQEIKTQIAVGNTAEIGVGFQVNDDTNNDGDRDAIAFSNGRLGDAWANPQCIERMKLIPDYQIETSITAEQGTLNPSAAYAGEVVVPQLSVAEEMMLVEGSVRLDGEPFELGSAFVMPNKNVLLTAEIVEKPEEFPIILPNIEGLTITSDRQTAKPGELVTLDIQLEDGYEFVQDDGMYDYGHFSNSQQKWVYFSSGPYGMAMTGRRLKVNGVSLPWSGNTFIMPDGEAVITAEVEAHPIANAVKQTVVLDGVRDETYALSRTIEVNRSTSSASRYKAGEGRAVGEINTAYDDNYLYCFASIYDPTKSDRNALNGDVASAKSLIGFDGITFFFDFLNTDNENTAVNEYRFVEEESGIFLIDALNLQQSSDGRIYDKLGGGFASFNGDKSKADYIVVATETGYHVELKIALSDSLKQRIAASNEMNRPEIGIGAMLMDDQNNNGGWDYEKSDKIVCSSSLITNVWNAMQFIRTEDGHLQVSADASPRWLSRMTLDYAPENSSSSTPPASSSQPESIPGSPDSSSEEETEVSSPAGESETSAVSPAGSEVNPATGGVSGRMIWIPVVLATAAVFAAGVIVMIQRKTYRE
ncbi:MAG: sugar-binding protein [Acutalibacteraceae bacterium]